MAVLDTMLEPIPGKQHSYVVYYSILDGDECGRTPIDPQFDSSTKSCLQKIAKSDDRVRTQQFHEHAVYTSHITISSTEFFSA